MMVQVRVALLLLGMIAFVAALQTGIEWLRWLGIAVVIIALLLRFYRPRRD